MRASGLALNLGTEKMSAPRTEGCVAPTANLDVLKRGRPLVFARNQKTIYLSSSLWSSHSTTRDFRLPLDT
jgi:hypothetical protein